MSGGVILAILAMAVATYATRAGGFLIGRLIPPAGRARAALDALPVAVLTALIAPEVTKGWPEATAAAVVLLAAWRLPGIAAVALGILTVAGLRAVG